MSEEVTPLELQYEAINRPVSASPEVDSQVSEARHEVDSILAAGALQGVSIEQQSEATAQPTTQAAPQETAPVYELTALQIGINIEAVRRAALSEASNA